MAALTDLSDLINRSTGGNSGTPQNVFWHKTSRVAGTVGTTPTAGRINSLWRYDGHPAGGVAPTTGAIPDNTTIGALPFTSPGGGRESFMTQAWCTGFNAGTLILYDRLFHIGGLSGTVTTAQSVQGAPASPALTRNTGGVGNMVFAEIYEAIGLTARTITMDYTDDAGNASSTSIAASMGGSGFREVNRVMLLPLASGDRGVQAVNTVTLSATTGTAGNFGIVIGKPIAYIGVGFPGAPAWRDFVSGLPGIPEIETGACLSLLWVPTTAANPEMFGGYSIVEA
jgi:hypothetical protein